MASVKLIEPKKKPKYFQLSRHCHGEWKIGAALWPL